MVNETDLKEIGIPMGPRKKLIGFITSQGDKIKQAQVSIQQLWIVTIFDWIQERAKQKAEELTKDQTDGERIQKVKFSISVDGLAGTGQPYVSYKSLDFKPCNLFLIGSPVGLFLTVRWVSTSKTL